jgi:predicted transcriptional regulator
MVNKKETETIRINFDLKKMWYDKLKAIAETQGRSVSDILRQLIINFVRDEQKEMKEEE